VPSPHRQARRSRVAASLAAVAVLALAACSSSSHGGTTSPRPTTAAPTTAAPTSAATPAPSPPPTTTDAPTASAAPTSTVPATLAPASLRWVPCTESDLKAADQCSSLQVPLDRSKPTGTQITLALVRRPAGVPSKRTGSLLINPGGPGGSTLSEFDFLADGLSSSVRQQLDVVGWDPRGVGKSDPLKCFDGPTGDRLLADSPDLTTAAGQAKSQSDARELAAGCAKYSGALLPFVGTVDTAKDMDAIRAAVGDDKLTYLGYSYGTFIGTVYAQLFPTKVRALALDGAVDSTVDPITSTEVQADGFENNLKAFLADCSSSAGCAFHPGGDLLTAVRSLRARVQATPMKTSLGNRMLTESLFQTGVAAALYSKDTWPTLQMGLSNAEGGDGTLLLALSDALDERAQDGSYSALIPALNAVNCLDYSYPSGLAPYLASYQRLQKTAPDFADEAVGSYVCSIWPAKAAQARPPLPVSGVPPIVIVGTTNDPATPFTEAQGLQRSISGSVLVTRVGSGHTGYDASACVRGYVDAYLERLTVPRAGARCTS